MKLLRRTFFHVMFLLVLGIYISHQTASARNILLEDTSTVTDTVKTPVKDIIFGDNTFNKFGLSAGAVLKEDFDTGFGFGLKLKRPLFYPRLELTMSGYLWGASVDSLDVTSIGFEEELTFKKTFPIGTTFFSGIVAGYYITNNRTETIISNKPHVIEEGKATFEAYLTYGVDQPLERNRSLFAQVKYGLTLDKPEIHVLIGMYFSK